MGTKVHRTVTLHEGRVFRLVSERVSLDNGVITDMEVIRHPGASAVVALSHGNTLLLLKQYRHALGEYIWEIPAGTLNRGETPLECAKRELIEETGFSGTVWHDLGTILPVPGYSDERVHLFLARDLEPARQNLDYDELLEVNRIGLDQAMEMIQRGEIQDGKTVSGLFLARCWLSAR